MIYIIHVSCYHFFLFSFLYMHQFVSKGLLECDNRRNNIYHFYLWKIKFDFKQNVQVYTLKYLLFECIEINENPFKNIVIYNNWNEQVLMYSLLFFFSVKSILSSQNCDCSLLFWPLFWYINRTIECYSFSFFRYM